MDAGVGNLRPHVGTGVHGLSKYVLHRSIRDRGETPVRPRLPV